MLRYLSGAAALQEPMLEGGAASIPSSGADNGSAAAIAGAYAGGASVPAGPVGCLPQPARQLALAPRSTETLAVSEQDRHAHLRRGT